MLRIGTREQKIIEEIRRNGTQKKSNFLKIMTISSSHLERVLNNLDKRKLIYFQGNSVGLRNRETINIKTYNDVSLFFDNIMNVGLFPLEITPKGDYFMNIKTHFLWQGLFDDVVSENISLQSMKRKETVTYNKLYEQLCSMFWNIISVGKEKILKWSNEKYTINLDSLGNICLSDINEKNIIIYRDKEFYKKKKLSFAKTLSECVYLFLKTLRELQNHIKSIGYTDYSSFTI